VPDEVPKDRFVPVAVQTVAASAINSPTEGTSLTATLTTAEFKEQDHL